MPDSQHAAVELAILGPQHTNSDLAASRYQKTLKRKLKKIYLPTIASVFKAVVKGHAKKGIVPLENSETGKVKETTLALKKHRIKHLQKIKLYIRYALVALPDTKKENIKTISSHRQALQQCKKYLKKNYPSCLLQKSSSTVAALEKITKAENRYSAAIIPLEVVRNFKLKILARNIQDHAKNATTFIVIESAA